MEGFGSGRYPSTPHLPFSPEVFSDDVKLSACSYLCNEEVVVTEKLDGGNCCLKEGKVYARTHSKETTHASFSAVKDMYMNFAYEVDPSLHLFGENMLGIHSIEYSNLESFFYLFAVRRMTEDGQAKILSWDETVDVARQCGVPTAPVLFRGYFESTEDIQKWMDARAKEASAVGDAKPEGFVVRVAREFDDSKFGESIAKYVRKGHVQTDESWMRTWKKATLGRPKTTVPETRPKPGGSSQRPESAPSRESAKQSVAGGEKATCGKVQKQQVKEDKALLASKKSAFKEAPRFVLLCGLPGSGKSTFSKALVENAAVPNAWIHVCQDDIGSRGTCESMVGAGIKKSKVVLDRCNPTASERKQWLALAMHPKTSAVVYFKTNAELCKKRVAARTDHPTIPCGRGERIVATFAKQMEEPSEKEGFSRVIVVETPEQAASLLSRWGSAPPANPGAATSSQASSTPVASSHATAQSAGPQCSSTSSEKTIQSGAPSSEFDLIKFPRTHHVVNTGGSAVTRDDLVMDPLVAQAFYGSNLTVSIEEKIDGANLGITIAPDGSIRAQNRSHFVNSESMSQFKLLDTWLEDHREDIFKVISPGKDVLYGEWVYAKHSVAYTRLPDYFLAFDIFDTTKNKFLSRQARDARLEKTSLHRVPLIAERVINGKDDMLSLLNNISAFNTETNIEGVYLRIDGQPGITPSVMSACLNEGKEKTKKGGKKGGKGPRAASVSSEVSDPGYLFFRGKVVSPDFIQAIDEHWCKMKLVKNQIWY